MMQAQAEQQRGRLIPGLRPLIILRTRLNCFSVLVLIPTNDFRRRYCVAYTLKGLYIILGFINFFSRQSCEFWLNTSHRKKGTILLCRIHIQWQWRQSDAMFCFSCSTNYRVTERCIQPPKESTEMNTIHKVHQIYRNHHCQTTHTTLEHHHI